MPDRFSLTRKSNIDAGPVALRQIDKEMCEHFGIIHDPNSYHHQWVSTIGDALASGRTLDEIIRDCKEGTAEYPESSRYYETKLRIAEYLNNNYVSGGAGKDR